KLRAAMSALKKTRQAYSLYRARWKAVAEHGLGGVMLADRRGTIRYVNRAAAAPLKHKREALIGKPTDLLAPRSELGHPLQLGLAVKAPDELTSRTEEAKIVCGDGKERRMIVRITEFVAGDVRGFVLLLRDAAPLE